MAAYVIGGHVRCFECRYDLSGLPERALCPECGKPYNTATARQPLTADEIMEELNTLPEKAARALWERYCPSPRTVMILISVLGTAAVVGTLAVIALNTLMNKFRWF